METLNKTATQIMAETEQLTKCCANWRSGVNGIRVTPLGESEPEKTLTTLAFVMEKLFKSQMGNFCPTCGNKL